MTDLTFQTAADSPWAQAPLGEDWSNDPRSALLIEVDAQPAATGVFDHRAARTACLEVVRIKEWL
ncbi:hypothetical protein M728_006011 (plasmid) [Ensifer sp. WSM1721]